MNKLQTHIEQEEIRWNQQLEKKQQEIDGLRKEQESAVESLNSQVSITGGDEHGLSERVICLRD